jgi:hypothetical protein
VVLKRNEYEGRAKKRRRENDVHLRQLAKKSTHVLFFLVRFWAFLGKGSLKTREKDLSLSTCQKKSPGKYFFKGGFFSGWIFPTSFSFDFFVALVKRLSVRGTQKRDKKCFAGSCV